MLQNEWQPNILDILYQIMFKITILSQIGADRYQKHIFKIVLLSPPPPWRAVHCSFSIQLEIKNWLKRAEILIFI